MKEDSHLTNLNLGGVTHLGGEGVTGHMAESVVSALSGARRCRTWVCWEGGEQFGLQQKPEGGAGGDGGAGGAGGDAVGAAVLCTAVV